MTKASEKEIEVSETELNPEVAEHKAGEKKEEVIKQEQAQEAAQKIDDEKRQGVVHTHSLMDHKYKLNLLEISHRTIEKIEKERFAIMNKYSGEEAVAKFKDFVFAELCN